MPQVVTASPPPPSFPPPYTRCDCTNLLLLKESPPSHLPCPTQDFSSTVQRFHPTSCSPLLTPPPSSPLPPPPPSSPCPNVTVQDPSSPAQSGPAPLSEPARTSPAPHSGWRCDCCSESLCDCSNQTSGSQAPECGCGGPMERGRATQLP
jgi:hypothetical protein